MPLRVTRRENVAKLRLEPPGSGGLDLYTDENMLSERRLRRSEHVRNMTSGIERRQGAKKIATLTDSTGSWTFGATTKYATIPAATQLQIAQGGFGIRFSITAVRPGAGNTGYILSSRVDGQSYHVVYATIDENGLLTVGWTKSSDSSDVSVTTSALTDDGAADVLAIFDAELGTFTVYVDGESNGTPVTGIDSTEKPIAGSGTAWHLGVHYNPATAGVVANTNFDGKVDAVTLFSFAGLRLTDGDPTLLATLRKWSLQQWPNPDSAMVLFQYDCDEGSGTTLEDASRFKNHGTLTGSPTATADVAYPTVLGNFVGTFEDATSERTNLVAAGGALYYEVIQQGAS